jgi:hypothetical protein
VLDLSKLHADLVAARGAGLAVASKAKTAEGLLQGVQRALPAWLQLTRAQV